jgi:transposase
LKRTEYACEEDARNAAEPWIKEHKRFRFSNLSIEKKLRRRNGKGGRLKKGEETCTKSYDEVDILPFQEGC